MKDFKAEVEVVFTEVSKFLTAESKALLEYLPRSIANQLLLDRDPHGNV